MVWWDDERLGAKSYASPPPPSNAPKPAVANHPDMDAPGAYGTGGYNSICICQLQDRFPQTVVKESAPEEGALASWSSEEQ